MHSLAVGFNSGFDPIPGGLVMYMSLGEVFAPVDMLCSTANWLLDSNKHFK